MSSLNVTATAVTRVEVIPGGKVVGTIQPPGSKSLTNRAILCAAFANGRSTLTGVLDSEDTQVMIASLRQLGIEIEPLADQQAACSIVGKSERVGFADSNAAELYIANSGTTIRFLVAALSALGGHYRLSGVPRMHQRPIGDLLQALAAVVDGSVLSEQQNGCPPVIVHTAGWKHHHLQVAGNVSSQYLSGLMMAAPISRQRVEIEVVGELVSRPYVDMTVALMRSFGAQVSLHENASGSLRCVIEASDGYRAVQYAIEPDASAASYFWAAAAITGGEVTVTGLGPDALQGDVHFVDCLEQMGCVVTRRPDSITVSGRASRGIDIDMNPISDTVQTLSVVALFADAPTRVRGVAHNRFKETDRIGDLARELRKLGAVIDEHEDGLTIHPLGDDLSFAGADLETYHDHRMAMSLSLAGLRLSGVRIMNPSCTSKTYPEFFADLEKLIGHAHHWHAPAMAE